MDDRLFIQWLKENYPDFTTIALEEFENWYDKLEGD